MAWLKKARFSLLLGLLLLFLFSLPACFVSYASETTYKITAAELTQLEMNLSQLEENSKHKQTLLENQSEQLKRLNAQLLQSLRLNEETRNSLQTAEESLKEYEQEAKRKAAIKDRQRNTWAALAIGALAWAIAK